MYSRAIFSGCSSLLKNAFATCVSLLVWVATYVFIYVIFTFFSVTQGTNGWFEIMCREVFCSGIGGYLALYVVKRWIPTASPNFAFWGFSLIVFTFMTAVRLVGLPYCLISGECTFVWSEQIGTLLAGIAAIFGATLAYHADMSFYNNVEKD